MNPYQNSFGGNIPQDVAGKQGENVIFIVYTLKDTPETLDKVKDVCANFSGMIRSMRNRFPELMFSCTMGFGADAWSRLFPEKGKPKELNTFEEIKDGKRLSSSTGVPPICKNRSSSNAVRCTVTGSSAASCTKGIAIEKTITPRRAIRLKRWNVSRLKSRR